MSKELNDQTIDLDLQLSLASCLARLKQTSQKLSSDLPTGSQIILRIQQWPGSGLVNQFISKMSRHYNDEWASAQNVRDRLQALADQGNSAANHALGSLDSAMKNVSDPVHWVEIVVSTDLSSATVDALNRQRNNSRIRWKDQRDDKVQVEVVLPLTHWDTGETGSEPVHALGQVAKVDEVAMKRRLQDMLVKSKHGGIVGSTTPVILRPDGRYVFFSALVPIEKD